MRAETVMKAGKAGKAGPSTVTASFQTLFPHMQPSLQNVMQGFLEELRGFDAVMALHRSAPEGAFLGYDGITNRGDFSDLLMSELVLRDLDEMEFIRKIAEFEAGFRRKAYETKGGGRALGLVLDCGAWMLGQNRLLALAGLFWLQHLALREKSAFYWRSSYDTGDWHDRLSAKALSDYMGRVAQKELDEAALKQAIALFPSTKDKDPEFWFIGPENYATSDLVTHVDAMLLVGLPRKSADRQAPATAQLSLFLNGTLRRQSEITYPEEGPCIAALRNPFMLNREMAKTAAPSTAKNAILSQNWYAEHWIETANGGFIIRWPKGLLIFEKNEAQAVQGWWVALSKDIIGIHHRGTKILIILCAGPDKETLTFLDLETSDGTLSATQKPLILVGGAKPNLNFGAQALPRLLRTEEGPLLCLYDAQGRAYDLDMDSGRMQKSARATDTLAMRTLGGEIHVAPVSKETAGAETAGDETQIDVYRRDEFRSSLQFSSSLPTKNKPLHWLIATSDRAIAFSTERGYYHSLFEEGTRSLAGGFKMPAGHIPFLLSGRASGYSYNQANGDVFRFKRGDGHGLTTARTNLINGPVVGLSHIRMCGHGRGGAGLLFKDETPHQFVEIKLRQRVSAFKMHDLETILADAVPMRKKS